MNIYAAALGAWLGNGHSMTSMCFVAENEESAHDRALKAVHSKYPSSHGYYRHTVSICAVHDEMVQLVKGE